MSPRAQKITKIGAWLTLASMLAGLVVPAAAYASREFDAAMATKLNVTRYERDRSVDSLEHLQERAVLNRLDERVRDVYCATIPPANQKGCR